jgi:hypothetical protein
LIGTPITPNIIQTMKQTVKARVLTISTDQALRCWINSLAILILQTHAMSVVFWRSFGYPPEA